MLQTENLFDILNLFVLHDLIVFRITDVEKLSSQWEDTVVITTYDTKTGNCKRLCRVSFRQDERTIGSLLSTGIVGIGQFREALEPIKRLATNFYPKERASPITSFTVGFLELLVCLSIRPIKNLVDDGRLLD